MVDRPVVVVAGTVGDIGRATVEVLAGSGWQVAALDVGDPVDPSGRAALAVQRDLTDDRAAASGVAEARERLGPPRAVVHTIMSDMDFVETAAIPWSRWRNTFEVGLGSFHHLAAATVEDVKAAGTQGSVVALSSIGARTPLPGVADYCAIKAAVSSYIRNLAIDLAPYGARANAVSPAFVDSRRVAEAPVAGLTEGWHPLKRNGKPHEIAQFIEFLLSDRAQWMSGHDYPMDGAFEVRPPGQ